MTLPRNSYLIALGVAVLFAGAHYLNGREPDSTVTRSSKALLATAGKFWATQDSLKALEGRYDTLAWNASHLETVLKGRVSGDSTAVSQAHTGADSLQGLVREVGDIGRALVACDSSSRLLGAALGVCRQRAESLTLRVDTLEHALKAQIGVKPPRCSWGVGAGVSAVAPHVDVVLGRFCRL